MKPVSSNSPSSNTNGKKSQRRKVTFSKQKVTKSSSKTTSPNSTKMKKSFCRADFFKQNENHLFQQALLKVFQEENIFFSDAEHSLEQFSKLLKQKWSPPTNRTATGIKNLVKFYTRRIKKQRIQNDKPIDKWAELFAALTPPSNSLKGQIASALMVATEEPVPEVLTPNAPASTEKKDLPEPNYTAVYKYLAAAVTGSSLPELSPIDSLLIEDCVQSLAEQIKFLDDGDLRLCLRRIYLYLNKSEGRPLVDDEEDIIQQLSLGSLFNPLGLNQNLITPVPPN